MANYIKKIRTNSGDLQIDYNALANLPTISNPNLLINSDFRKPVNQRGQTTYKSSAGDWSRVYTIDRWNMQNGSTCTVNSASITLQGNTAASGTSCFCQIIDGALPADTYTVQVKVKSISNGGALSITNSASQQVLSQNLSVGVNTFTVQNVAVFFVSIDLGANSKVELEWIKLEQGATATAFSPRSYGEELALCQRYTYAWFPADHYTLAYHIFKSDTNNINFSVQLPVTMRSTPSLQVLGGGVSCVANDDFGTAYGSVSIQMDTANAYTAKVKATFGVNLWRDCPVEFFAYSQLGLLFDAEIR